MAPDGSPPPPVDPRDAIFDTSAIRNIGRKAGNTSVLLLAMSGVRTVQQMAGIAILARLIPPAEYGIFALALPGVLLVMALSNFGLPQAIVQRREMDHETVSSLFWVNALFGVVAMVVVIGLAWPAAQHFNEPRVIPVYWVLSVSVLMAAISGQYQAILRRVMRISEAAVVPFITDTAALAVAIAAAYAGMSYWALVLQQLTSQIFTVVALVAIVRWKPSGPFGLNYWKAKGAIVFGGYVAGYSIANRFTEYAGTMLAGSMFDSAAAGLFFRARNLASMPSQKAIRPLSGAFVPTISRLQDDPVELRRMYRRMLNRSFLIMLPISLLMMVAAKPLTLLLLGHQWAELSPLLFWMSFYSLRQPIAATLHFTMIGCGASRTLFLMSLVRFAIVTGVLHLFAPLGLQGMTAAYMLTEMLVTLPMMAAVAVYTTPLLWRTIIRAIWVDTLLGAGLALVLWFGFNPLIASLPALPQALLVAAVIGLAFLARVLCSSQLRNELARVVQRTITKIRGKLGKKP